MDSCIAWSAHHAGPTAIAAASSNFRFVEVVETGCKAAGAACQLAKKREKPREAFQRVPRRK
jgi:hypothetical protein